MNSIDQIREIRKAANLVEIVKEHTELTKRGEEMIGDCPFCRSKGSFNVDREKTFFRCDGCEIGGDVITFVMEKLNLTFPEASNWLCEKYDLVMRDVLWESLKNYHWDLKNCFDCWMRGEIEDKEFIFKMNQLITLLANEVKEESEEGENDQDRAF